jgi:hypothetical protein
VQPNTTPWSSRRRVARRDEEVPRSRSKPPPSFPGEACAPAAIPVPSSTRKADRTQQPERRHATRTGRISLSPLRGFAPAPFGSETMSWHGRAAARDLDLADHLRRRRRSRDGRLEAPTSSTSKLGRFDSTQSAPVLRASLSDRQAPYGSILRICTDLRHVGRAHHATRARLRWRTCPSKTTLAGTQSASEPSRISFRSPAISCLNVSQRAGTTGSSWMST